MSDREKSEKRDEESKETDTRPESTSMEETERRNPDLRRRESDGITDRRRERDPRSGKEKRENATQMRYDAGQSSEYPFRTGVEDCYYYLKNGHCGYGRSCRFNHPPMRHEMEQPSPYPVRPQLPESSQMRHETVQSSPYPGARDCRQYLKTGKCSYGPKCRFNHPPAHSPPELPQRVSRQNCKFFPKGNCKYGSDCKFTHSVRGEGAEPMRQATTWGKKFHEKRHGAKSNTRPWKRERQAHDLDEQNQKKRNVGNLRIDPTGPSGLGTEQRLEVPENPNINAQENLQEQADDMERQNREAQEKAQEERRQQIDNARREARLRLERMRPRVLTGNVDQLREALPDIGIDRKEGDGF